MRRFLFSSFFCVGPYSHKDQGDEALRSVLVFGRDYRRIVVF